MVEVATFDENDEMTIKRVPAQVLPEGSIRMEAPKPPVLKISKEISGDRFIDNLEKINRDRVLNVAIEETSVHH